MTETHNAVFIGSLIELELDQEDGPIVYIKLNRLPATDQIKLPSGIQRPKGYHKVIVTKKELMIRVISVPIPDGAVLMIEGNLIRDMWPGVAGIEATNVFLFDAKTFEPRPLKR